MYHSKLFCEIQIIYGQHYDISGEYQQEKSGHSNIKVKLMLIFPNLRMVYFSPTLCGIVWIKQNEYIKNDNIFV